MIKEKEVPAIQWDTVIDPFKMCRRAPEMCVTLTERSGAMLNSAARDALRASGKHGFDIKTSSESKAAMFAPFDGGAYSMPGPNGAVSSRPLHEFLISVGYKTGHRYVLVLDGENLVLLPEEFARGRK